MRSALSASVLLCLTQSSMAFTIIPVPGAGAGVPQFVASGIGANMGSSPFYGSGSIPAFRDAVKPLDPGAYGNQFQFRSGQFLFGSEAFTTASSFLAPGLVSPSFAAPLSTRFGLAPALSGSAWSVNSASIGYLAADNLLFYSGVSQARPSASSSALPIPPGLALREERGLTAARAGVQWQAMPGLTLGVEVSGITGQR